MKITGAMAHSVLLTETVLVIFGRRIKDGSLSLSGEYVAQCLKADHETRQNHIAVLLY